MSFVAPTDTDTCWRLLITPNAASKCTYFNEHILKYAHVKVCILWKMHMLRLGSTYMTRLHTWKLWSVHTSKDILKYTHFKVCTLLQKHTSAYTHASVSFDSMRSSKYVFFEACVLWCFYSLKDMYIEVCVLKSVPLYECGAINQQKPHKPWWTRSQDFGTPPPIRTR